MSDEHAENPQRSRSHMGEGRNHAWDPAPIQGDLAAKWHAIYAEMEEIYRDSFQLHRLNKFNRLGADVLAVPPAR